MPRTNLGKTKQEQRNERIRIVISEGLGRSRMTKPQLAEKVGVSIKSIYNYYNRPETMPTSVLFDICDVLRIKLEDFNAGKSNFRVDV